MPSPSNLARRLTAGLYGRLEFDFACNRGHGFGEAHLQGVLMEILASNINPSEMTIEPSYAIPAIQRIAPDGAEGAIRGRPREVDFAVMPRRPSADGTDELTCIETKWAGSSHASAKNILRDLTRLALIHENHPTAVCLFLLAGKREAVEKTLQVKLPALSTGGSKSLLRYPHDGRTNKFNLAKGPGNGLRALEPKQLTDLQEIFSTVPDRIGTYLHKPSHESPPQWSAQVWRVYSFPFNRPSTG